MRDIHETVRNNVTLHSAGRSLREVARDAEVPYSTLHQQMTEARFSLDVLSALSRSLGVAISALVEESPDQQARQLSSEVSRSGLTC